MNNSNPTPDDPIPDVSDSTRSAPARETESPAQALSTLRRKMEAVADEFSQGKINRAQFNALYKRYSEQRAIIERLIARNPGSSAWKQVIGVQGQTGFLRQHLEAQTLYYAIFHRDNPQMLASGGKQTPDEALIVPLLKAVWTLPSRPKLGLGRKQIGATHWLLLAVGDHASTAVMFSLEPAIEQARLVRDLHADFERANQAALARGWIVPERMVFPQRALVESAF